MSEEDKSPEEYVKEAFDAGALAITLINGKPAPWAPFGLSHEQEIEWFKKRAEERRRKKEEES